MIVRKIVISFCNNIRHFSNEINKRGGGIFFCGGWNFSKSVSVGPTFIREMRVGTYSRSRIRTDAVRSGKLNKPVLILYYHLTRRNLRLTRNLVYGDFLRS